MANEQLLAAMVEQMQRQNEYIARILERQMEAGQNQRAVVVQMTPSTINKFDGQSGEIATKAVFFLRQVSDLAVTHGWQPEQKLTVALANLTESARQWQLGRGDAIATWDEFETQFRAMFVGERGMARKWNDMKQCKQRSGISAQVYFHEKLRLCRELNLNWNDQREEIILGLASKELALHLQACKPNNENELFAEINEYERVTGSIKVERRTNSVKPVTCFRCKKEGHLSRDCSERRIELICYRCKASGHIAKDCTKEDSRRCYKCDQPGHFANVCSIKKENVNFVGERTSVHKYRKKVSLGCGCEFVGLVDTGSEHCIVRESLIKPNAEVDKTVVRILTGFTGSGKMKVVTIGTIITNMTIDEVTCREIVVLVVNDKDLAENAIIGRSFLERPNVNYMKCGGEFTISSSGNPVFEIETTDESDSDVEVMAVKECSTAITEKQVTIGDGITTEQKNELLTMLNENRVCFAMKMNELGLTKEAEMKIELVDNATAVAQKPYRASNAERNEMKQIVEGWRKLGIVVDTTSPFASPVLLVKKSSGENRLVVDYRAVNKITKSQPFPMSEIDDIVKGMSGNTLFTTLDLAHGYLQVPLERNSQPITAFITPDERGQFTRMIFGLKNAPAVFSELMAKLISRIKIEGVMNYLDDVIVTAKNWTEMRSKLEKVLKELGNSNLTLQPRKCRFCVSEIEFLGFSFSKNSMKPGRVKSTAIAAFPEPKNQHEVRRFLGLTGYFRRFIKDYARLAQPLTNLLRKSVRFKFDDAERECFGKMKQQLVSDPVLALYDPSRETEVHTDASAQGLSGILMQRSDDNEFHPVYYVSKKTTEHEMNYHSSKLELLAIIWTLDRLRNWLIDIQFTVVTDCQALVYLNQHRTSKAQIYRWYILLQEYQMTIKYRNGSKMPHVDALSRAPCEESTEPWDEEIVVVNNMNVTTTDESTIVSFQRSDELIRKKIKILEKEAAERTSAEKREVQGFELEDGVLFARKDGKRLLYVPKSGRRNVLIKCHDLFGHFAEAKTVDKIRERFYFPGMRRFVKNHIAGCIDCLRTKIPGGKTKGRLHPIEPGRRPFATIHVDHFGPLKESERGNRYIFVIVCNLTKFVRLVATETTSVKEVIRAMNEFINTYGRPETIVSDRGTAFISKDWTEFCTNMGIKCVLNAVNHPRANGQVERVNRVLQPMLVVEPDCEQRWDEALTKIECDINNTVNATTGRTPFEVLHGYRAVFDAPGMSMMEDEWIPSATLQEDVKQQLTERAAQVKTRFDEMRGQAEKLRVGEIAMKRVRNEQAGKLSAKYDGPYEVIGRKSEDTYVIRNITPERLGYETVSHIGLLKIYRGDEEVSERPQRRRRRPMRFDDYVFEGED